MEKDSLYKVTKNLISQNKETEALKIVLEQIDKLPNIDHKRARWFSLGGDIFRDNQEFKKGLEYYKKAYDINSQLKDSLSLMSNHINLGTIFQNQLNDLYDSLYIEKALKLKDSTLFYYNKNIYKFNHIKKGLPYLATTYNNTALLYSDYEKLDSAQTFISNSIRINKKVFGPNSDELITSLTNQGLIYIYQKKYKKAVNIYNTILNKSTDTARVKVLNNKKIATGNLYYIYQQTQKYKKAFEYSVEYNDLTERIADKRKAAEITTIEAKYNVDKARQEEQLVTLEVEKKQQRTQSIAIIGGLVALSIILLGTILYRNSKLKQKSLSLSLVQQELDKQQEIRLLQKQTQSKVLNATLDGREKERKDIAQTLHDSVSALLSSANMHLQVIKKKTNGDINEVNKSQLIINEASDKVRDLSHKLISAVLLKFGIEHAVYEMCEKYSNEDLHFELESEDPIPRFSEDFEIKMNNILEEFINNILKHSKATEAIIRLTYSNEILDLSIKDNGVGFDTSKINPKSGIGLSQIKARIENLDGTIAIKSNSNDGTYISIKVPAKTLVDLQEIS